MRRAMFAAVISILVGGLALSLASPSYSQRSRGRGRATKTKVSKVVAAPTSEHIVEALGTLRWGMTKDEVLASFVSKIQEEYRLPLAKSPDAIQEDRVRAEMNEKIRRIAESYVVFDERSTTWDVSFLKDEYTHRNGESMLVRQEADAQDFYFFFNGRLWKWFKAFDNSSFAGQSFTQFAEAIQGRFGAAQEKTGPLLDGGENRHWLEWQDETTRLRAVDLTQFYGFYCMVFEEKATVARLSELRVNRPASRQNRSLLDQVLATPPSSTDGNADIVDRLTGKIRNRQDAPEPSKNAPTKSKNTKAPAPPATPTPAPADDPLRGM